jgi:hypothetical protein
MTVQADEQAEGWQSRLAGFLISYQPFTASKSSVTL